MQDQSCSERAPNEVPITLNDTKYPLAGIKGKSLKQITGLKKKSQR